AAVVAHEADLAAAVLHLELEDAVVPHHADELADLGDVHARGPGPVYSKAGRPRKPNRATRVSRRRRTRSGCWAGSRRPVSQSPPGTASPCCWSTRRSPAHVGPRRTRGRWTARSGRTAPRRRCGRCRRGGGG